MHLAILLVVVAASFLAGTNAAAIRHEHTQQKVVSTDSVACEVVDKYTPEWFLRNVKAQYANGFDNNALFYSRGMSQMARDFARQKQNNMVTVWDVWPCYLYNDRQIPQNPLRCIHGSRAHQLKFFENMSRAFALKARNFSTVMHSSEDFKSPPTNGIWARVELPTLKESKYMDMLVKIDTTKTLSEIFWRRPKKLLDFMTTVKRSPASNPGSTGSAITNNLDKRLEDSTPESCMTMTAEDYRRLDSIGW